MIDLLPLSRKNIGIVKNTSRDLIKNKPTTRLVNEYETITIDQSSNRHFPP